MKPFRIVHMVFGALAAVPLLWLAAALVLPPFRDAEMSRIEGLQACLERKLEAYRGTAGHYPDSLQALAFTNSPQEFRAQSDAKRMTYSRMDSGYQLSYEGFWYNYTLSVSNNGADVFQRTKARL